MKSARSKWIAGLCLLLCIGCGEAGPDAGPAPSPPPSAAGTNPALVARIDRALQASAAFLVAQQSPDGEWRSSTYGFMKDGPSLTPHVMSALYFLPKQAEREDSFDRGVEYLVSLVGTDGRVPADLKLIYPVYTAADASRLVLKGERTPRHDSARRAWLEYLKSHQLGAQNGWRPGDESYGGWGYAQAPAQRPPEGRLAGPWDWANLSATVYAIGALRESGVAAADPSMREVLGFVLRCQNFSDSAGGESAFDDGGFFFCLGEPLRNKAGVAGVDAFGRTRYHSYGSMTCDGLRAMLACGLSHDNPRVVAARRWIHANFSVEHNPGTFEPANEDIRDATYYYYCWSLAHALMHLRERTIHTPAGPVDWAEALAGELLKRQREDGTWVNRFTDAREDDPLVSTPMAAAALVICRKVMEGEGAGH